MSLNVLPNSSVAGTRSGCTPREAEGLRAPGWPPTAQVPRWQRMLYGAFHFFGQQFTPLSGWAPGHPGLSLPCHPEARSFHRGKVSNRFLCCPGSETKGVIYYCVRVVYTWEEYAPNAVPPAFLCATYNSGRCSVFLHITVYNMHIVLEACSPSASVSGVWVYLRRKKKACILALYVSCISQQQLAFCLKKAKMLKSKQSCFPFCPLCKCVTKMLIMTV